METIEDIRKQFGNPNAGNPDGPVQPINRSFHDPDSSLRLGALIVFLIGIVIMLTGVYTLVIAISSIGLTVTVASFVMLWRATYMRHHRSDFERESSET
ncbi:MAG TPA: hypothetical protein VM008_10560 [Phycisphaerae bacterium]|nr:hypothetical protein [Phycisphaerae bacterium]